MTTKTITILVLIIAFFIPASCSSTADGPEAQSSSVVNGKIDPICNMTVLPEKAAAKFDYNDTTYFFCSQHCKESFEKEPEKYVESKQEGTTGSE